MEYKLGKNWNSIYDLDNNEKIYSGAVVRIYSVGLNIKNKENDFYDYIVSNIYNEGKHFELVCLSEGEGGNIMCVIKKHDEHGYALLSELKRMLDEGKENIFVNFNPQIKIE